MMKSLHNTDANGTTKNVSDVQFFGNVDAWQLICKASSEQEGWMKSTKAMDIGTGCLVQVTTQQRNQNGSYSIAEAITFVPGVCVFVTGDTERGVDRREIVSARTPEPQPEPSVEVFGRAAERFARSCEAARQQVVASVMTQEDRPPAETASESEEIEGPYIKYTGHRTVVPETESDPQLHADIRRELAKRFRKAKSSINSAGRELATAEDGTRAAVTPDGTEQSTPEDTESR